MNESNLERIDEFLGAVETALGRAGRQSKEILAEVRGDLHAHVKRLRSDGFTEDEAVGRALDQMGNPYELAHHVRWEVPPFGGELLTCVRYIAACGIGLWLIMLLWHFRAGAYGASGSLVVVGVLLLHLPVIVLLWPRVIWRSNRLFGLVPAGLAFAFALWLNAGGVQSHQTIDIGSLLIEEGALDLKQPSEGPVPALADSGRVSVSAVLIFTAAAFATLVLLFAMQQRAQRRIFLVVGLLAFAVIEVPFQVEEAFFRSDRELVQAYLDTSFERCGAYPTTEDATSNGPRLSNNHSRVRLAGEHFSLFWRRPLCSGFSIQYLSEDERIRVQD